MYRIRPLLPWVLLAWSAIAGAQNFPDKPIRPGTSMISFFIIPESIMRSGDRAIQCA